MKPALQIAILKTIVKWQAEEIAVRQARVEALEKAPAWQRIGHTGCGWDWQCWYCRSTKLDGHTATCIYNEKAQPHTITGSIEGDTETLTVTVPPQWEDIDEPTAVA